MIGDISGSRFLGQIIFSKEEILSLSKIRIIKKNLVHVHGLPSSLSNSDKLSQVEYFGQYGKIQKILLNSKVNAETNKKTFSVYITFSNEKEAAFAILAVDSLLIEGKLIRAFFGTTKYCNYFLNNTICPNEEKCMFLHKLVKNKDIIIDSNTVFSYNEHLNLAKKIIDFSNPETKMKVLNLSLPKNSIFPNINFIFLSEEEKEHSLHSTNISYIKSNSNSQELSYNYYNNNYNLLQENLQFNLINNFNNNNIYHKNLIKNNSISDLHINKTFDTLQINSLNSLRPKEKCNKIIDLNDPLVMHKIFHQQIKQILFSRVFLGEINNNKCYKKLEFLSFIKELSNKGINVNSLLNGCLDSIKNLDIDN